MAKVNEPLRESDADADADAVAALVHSYGQFSTHSKMLRDAVRVESYQRATSLNANNFKDKVVLDVGTGTGILSLLAVKAGAEHVYGVDVSSMVHTAREIVHLNTMGHKIDIIQGNVEDLDLTQVDIIISEWMGFCLLSEMMVDCLLKARDKFLVKGGLMLPSTTSLHLAAVEDCPAWETTVEFWNDVGGFNFSPVKTAAIEKGFIQTVHPDTVLTQSHRILGIDLQKDHFMLGQSNTFRLVANRAGQIHAFVAWFDYDFASLDNPVRVSTSPFSPPTHWKQTVFYLQDPVTVQPSEVVVGEVILESRQRDLIVRFSWSLEDDLGRPKQASEKTASYQVDAVE